VASPEYIQPFRLRSILASNDVDTVDLLTVFCDLTQFNHSACYKVPRLFSKTQLLHSARIFIDVLNLLEWG